MCEQTEIQKEYLGLDVVNIRLVKEPSIISEKAISSSSDATEVVRDLISEFDREVFCILNLTADGKPINFNIVSVGTLTATIVSTREVFKSSILSNSSSFLAFHCHPSGNPRPSYEDARSTQRLRDAGDLLDIKMVDHIIVGCGSKKVFSFQAHELMNGSDIVKAYENYRQGMDWER